MPIAMGERILLNVILYKLTFIMKNIYLYNNEENWGVPIWNLKYFFSFKYLAEVDYF